MNGSTSGGTLADNWRPQRTILSAIEAFLNPITDAFAAVTCPTPLTTSSSCSASGDTMTLTYNSCSFGNSTAIWSGSEILSSSAAVSCGSFPSEATSATLTRTFGSNTTRRLGNSVFSTSVDTSTASGYATPVSGGSTTTFVSSSSRSLTINGVHLVATKTQGSKSATVWDHTVSTPSGSPLTVDISGGIKTVNGQLMVQHNLANYTATVTFSNVTYASNGACCHPTGGSVSATLSGSKTGTEQLTFSSSGCGAATVVDSSGSSSNITLTHCF